MLALKNEMYHYHQDTEGILEYVNTLEDAQKNSNREGKPIMEDTLLLIATNIIF